MYVMHIAETVWLGGKGPSFDRFDWSKAGWCRIGINQAALLIPDCYAAIARDQGVMKIYQEQLDRNIWLIRKSQHVALFPGFTKTVEIELLRDQGVEYEYQGTAANAIWFLAHRGVKVIHFVGFDAITKSNPGYAGSFADRGWQGMSRDGLSRISADTLKMIEVTGVYPVWEDINV
jgi:hypothetical protein